MNEKTRKERDDGRTVCRLRSYFDEVAWKEHEGGGWTDTALEASPTRLHDWYAFKGHSRNRRHLRQKGDFFLDAGSGAMPYEVYSSGYRHHVCVDSSISGLKGARSRLGKRGHYVLADIRHLPFKEGVFEGLCSPYVIYHIPGVEGQTAAFRELHRSLKPGCSGVVIYDNPNHLGKRLQKLVAWSPGLTSLVARFADRFEKNDDVPERIKKALKARAVLLHYEPLPRATIVRSVQDENAISVHTHSLLTEPFKKRWLRDNTLWTIALSLLLWCESRAGSLFRPLAPVWCVVIKKKGQPSHDQCRYTHA